MERGRKWLVNFNAGKTQLVSFDQANNTGAIDVKMDGSALEEQLSFNMLGLTFSSKMDWGSYIVSMKFLFPHVARYLYQSTKRFCMKYCCHVWASIRSCYLELIDKLQKQINRIVDPSLAPSYEPLAHLRNLASLRLF